MNDYDSIQEAAFAAPRVPWRDGPQLDRYAEWEFEAERNDR